MHAAMLLAVIRHPRSVPRRARPVVLIVEDTLDQLDLYSLVVESELDVLKASRSETGYALACAELPDVILLDILMPDISGFALCQRLRENPATASIPIVFITADESSFRQARSVTWSSVFGVLKKPCPADRLLLTLRTAIGRKRGR
jgi:putative two-component system response regulator